MFNNYFDNVYLINLDRSVDRLENSTKELNRLNVDFERWSAVDGDNEKMLKRITILQY
jgi:GR25 family glycosyltransferase involved in LPS biosynthesis